MAAEPAAPGDPFGALGDAHRRRILKLIETTIAVVAARGGDLEAATSLGQEALAIPRQSIPSLLMVSQDLVAVLGDRHSDESAAREYLNQVAELSRPAWPA
jgi:hypothetical protein